MRHIVCYSGGVESALVAIEVVRRYGRDNVVLLNHDISPEAEDDDIKQYKQDIADNLLLPVSPCNATEKFPHLDPLKACMDIKAFKVGKGTELCTCKLKTEPFMAVLKKVDPAEAILYYGFTPEEEDRCARRLREMPGWKIEFPLLWPNRTIFDTAEIGIPKPAHYDIWKHGNCIGCLKAGWQHWYCVYVCRRDRWELAKEAEAFIGYAINRRSIDGKSRPCRLIEREAEFEELRQAGLPATEWIDSHKFWAMARGLLKEHQMEFEF